ncbi:hypothetical protein T484DRAFT_1836536 [Baffinella frigidus]|nr:hypothetical protein T484DRAFT_1836536 [Cryptophyta sp. CCMP2293]
MIAHQQRRAFILLGVAVTALLVLGSTAEAVSIACDPSDNSSSMLKARSRFIPAFVTHALRPALARLPTWATNSCKNPPPLASKALPAPARAILRGGGPLLSSAPKMSMSSTAAVANPLMVQDHFPRYSEVKAEHVVPGIKAIIAEGDAALAALEPTWRSDLGGGTGLLPQLAALEADLEKKAFVMSTAELLPLLEKMTDHLGRSWGIVSHLKAVKMTDHLGRSWGIVSHLKAVKDTEEMRTAVEEMQPAVTFSFLLMFEMRKVVEEMQLAVVDHGLRISQSSAIYKAIKVRAVNPTP